MKASLPKGTRDFLPNAAIKRQYLFDTIRTVFRKFGYAPIETPAFENLSTLTGKYGEEGDRLLFKVLNNGDFLSGADATALDARDSQKLVATISKRGLRYDLTVPFARFVVMHQNALTFPFKRYQIQPVWRADRPQKGRYQEFYQCDADVVGSTSLLYEAEFVQIYDEVFSTLNLPVRIRLNHRKVLTAIAEVAGIPDRLTEMTICIDKWDKIGADGVRRELEGRGIPSRSVDTILDALSAETIDALELKINSSSAGVTGIRELREVFAFLSETQVQSEVSFDPKLARGLDYYTGCIFEIEALNAEMGSLGGGGRYDDLTSVFGMSGTPGVGISFGAERIYDVMEAGNLFPESLHMAPQVLFIALDNEALTFAFKVATSVRRAGIQADIFPEVTKMQKQMRYANQIAVPRVAIIGASERQKGTVMLKNMMTGEQAEISVDALAEELKKA